jgi:hypothetical protein
VLPPSLKQLRDGWDRKLVQAKADAVRSNNVDRELLSGSRAAVRSSRDLMELVDALALRSGRKVTE